MDTCHICSKQVLPTATGVGTGYGTDKEGNKICYSCCAEQDKKFMQDNGKIALYLKEVDKVPTAIINWPGTLSIPILQYSRGKHNLARTRIDVWFVFDGSWWHGTQYGNYSELCHCKRTKKKY